MSVRDNLKYTIELLSRLDLRISTRTVRTKTENKRPRVVKRVETLLSYLVLRESSDREGGVRKHEFRVRDPWRPWRDGVPETTVEKIKSRTRRRPPSLWESQSNWEKWEHEDPEVRFLRVS